MRAREPDRSGKVTNNGVDIYYEVHGAGEPTLLLIPTYQIVHSHIYKMQVPFLADHYRVITYDSRGSGLSDRPQTDYGMDALVDDALAVLAEVGVDTFGTVSLSASSQTALFLTARCEARVLGMVIIGGWAGRDSTPDARAAWEARKALMLSDYDTFVEGFFEGVFSEPHSSKARDDGWDWAHGTDPETLVATSEYGWLHCDGREVIDKVTCPVLVIHGKDDGRIPFEMGEDLHARLPNSRLVAFEGGGHGPQARDPVKVNHLIRDFFGVKKPRASVFHRALTRPKRALFVSSPIGLGHVQRDLAIVRELRSLVPDLEVHWWAQHPVTRVLEEAGEFVHPASAAMASESQHWEEEASGHELHAFYAFRRMDEILLANFMRFHELVRNEPYDLWIGDESWEVDYYLHENPELKTAPYIFLTDVIGFLPVDEGDARECELTADYNAEMLEQRARFPYLRDLSLYIGDYEDLPVRAFGSGLPKIQDWARAWFEPVGYIAPFDPDLYRDTSALKKRLGYESEGPLLFAAVGGTAIGRSLLRKTTEAFALVRQRRSDAYMVIVTGPRIDPASLPDVEGLDKRPYVHNLFEHLACADAAVVQGGLSTTMELVATKRPFIYFPLRNHWEQMHHVTYRLDRYGAGIRLDYAATSPERLAGALDEALEHPVNYRNIVPGAARRAAERIASLL